MKHAITLIVSPLFAVIAISTVSNAAVIYDNGHPDTWYGFDITATEVADDFTLATTTSVTGVRLWTTEAYGFRDGAVLFDGHVDYRVYADNAGVPGSLLTQGVGQSVLRNDLGYHGHSFGVMRRFDTVFDFEQPFMAQGGSRYFVAVHFLESQSVYGEIYWASATYGVVGAPSHIRSMSGGPWTNSITTVGGIYGAHTLAFELLQGSVPEPIGITLAVVAVSFLHSRRRASRKLTWA